MRNENQMAVRDGEMISCTIEFINVGIVIGALLIGGLIILAWSCWYYKEK